MRVLCIYISFLSFIVYAHRVFSFHLRLKNFSKSKHKMGLHPRRSLNGVRSGKHMTRGKKTHSKTRKWLTHSGGEFPLAVLLISICSILKHFKTSSVGKKPCLVSAIRTVFRSHQIRSFEFDRTYLSIHHTLIEFEIIPRGFSQISAYIILFHT